MSIKKCDCPGCEMPNISDGPLCDNCKVACCGHHVDGEMYCPKCIDGLETRIRAEERERCAKIATNLSDYANCPEGSRAVLMGLGGIIANEIRKVTE